jgi:hypothetical protein
MNIEEIIIGCEFIGTDKVAGKEVNKYAKAKAIVTEKTTNSIELYIYATGKEGINSYQWLTFNDFEKRFI